jgi:hypothetical protein
MAVNAIVERARIDRMDVRRRKVKKMTVERVLAKKVSGEGYQLFCT